MVVCKRVCYRGTVQGVGFRYATHSLARGYPVTGFVRNLPTGEVELVAEGAPEDVQAFLEAVTQHWAGYIQEQMVHDETPMGYHHFVIRT